MPTSEVKQNLLMDYVSDLGHTGDWLWIGFERVRYNDTTSEFVWLDGTLSPWTAWGRGEPNDSGQGEGCTILKTNYWNDYPCDSPKRFVCETLPPSGEFILYDSNMALCL